MPGGLLSQGRLRADLAPIQAQIDADPEIQAFLRARPRGGFASPDMQQFTIAGAELLRRKGIAIPEGYHLGQTGQLESNFGVDDWLFNAIPAFAAPAAAGMVPSGGLSAGLDTSFGVPTAATSSVPAGGAVPTSAGLGGLGPAAGGLGGTLTDFFTNPQNLLGLGSVIGGLATQGDAGEGAEELRRINAITEARMRRADPLHQVAVNLAFGRLPTQYRQGVQMNNVSLPE